MKQLLEVFGSFLRENVDMVDTLLAAAKQHTPTARLQSSTSRSAVFTDTGSRPNRKELLDFMKQELSLPGIDVETIVGTAKDGSGVYRLDLLQGGKRIYRITLKQGTVGDKLNSEKFEGNLANALNAGKNCKQYAGAGPGFNSLATKVIKSISSPVLNKNCFVKLENKGITLSPSYVQHGVKSKSPKTDLISADGSVRISVKKKGGQFISAQGNETAAVFVNSALPDHYKTKNMLAKLLKEFFAYEKGYAVKKGKSPQEKKRIQLVRDFLTKRLLNAGGYDLLESIVREALLGEKKFMTPEAIPNYFLVWDEDGNGDLYTVDQFVKKVTARAKIDIRGRGGERGLALRGEV